MNNLKIIQNLKPVLILDERDNIRDLYSKKCTEMKIPFECSKSSEKILQNIEPGKYSIFVLEKCKAIQYIHDIEKCPTILLDSSRINPRQMVLELKKYSSDYILKFFEPDQFVQMVTWVINHKQRLAEQTDRMTESEKKLNSQIEWLLYKDMRRNKGIELAEKNVVYNLKTSLSQGGGMGNIISIIDVIKSTAEFNGDKCTIPAELVNLLFSNNQISRKTTDNLDFITDTLGKEAKLIESNSMEFIQKLPEFLKRIVVGLERKNLKIIYPEFKLKRKLWVDFDLMHLALEELLINAMKYSPMNNNITLFAHVHKDFFCISIMNTIPPNKNTLPPDYEKIIMEPFYRYASPNDEYFDLEIFSLGLGLTVTNHIIKKHNGLLYLNQLVDHTGSSKHDCVVAEIQLPVY